MTKEEIQAKAEEILKDNPWFEFRSVDTVNYRPHPYMVGPKHIEYSPGMYLDVEVAEKRGAHCMMPNCRLPYKEHTSDMVIFLSLKQNVPNKDGSEVLFELNQAFLKPDSETDCWVDGFSFVETKEKFRILPPEEGESKDG